MSATGGVGSRLVVASDRVWLGGGAVAAAWLAIRDGRIEAIGAGRPPAIPDVDLTGRLVVPGFVDIHNHGGGGASFTTGDAGAAVTAAAHHRRHGTTTVVASLVSAPLGELTRAVRALAPLVADGTIAGVHVEGPWLSPARAGAHPPAHLRRPTPADVDGLIGAAEGVLRMVTVAPELDGGLDAVRRIASAGVVAAVGHTDATYETTLAAIDAGATVATHLGNAMAPVHHRAPGPVLACLADRRVAVELIADGLHLHDAMLAHLAAVAGPGRAVLVTDAMAAAGAGDGEYRLGDRRVVVEGRAARLGDGEGPLAGSLLTLDAALRRSVRAGVGLLDALTAVTVAPAAAIGLGDRAGTLASGRRADLVALDGDLQVTAVLAGGRRVR